MKYDPNIIQYSVSTSRGIEKTYTSKTVDKLQIYYNFRFFLHISEQDNSEIYIEGETFRIEQHFPFSAEFRDEIYS